MFFLSKKFQRGKAPAAAEFDGAAVQEEQPSAYAYFYPEEIKATGELSILGP